jgi:D-glycero-D-manno-heptose 1,7-bisphosphate phosphatase
LVPEHLALVPGAAAAVRRLNEAAVPVVLVSNQAKVGNRTISEAVHDAIHARLVDLLAAEGAWLDGVYYCLHDRDTGCDCRKPQPGSFLRAARELGLDLSRSAFAGDDPRDVRAGRAAGVAPVLVLTGHTDAATAAGLDAALVAEDLPAAAEWFLAQVGR